MVGIYTHLVNSNISTVPQPKKDLGKGLVSSLRKLAGLKWENPRRYPVMIEAGDENTAWSVVVPDLPGCFSAGDTLDKAMTAVEEVAVAWIDATLDTGREIPSPSAMQDTMAKGDFSGWIVACVDVDPTLMDDTIERVNITLPRRVLERIDAKVAAAGETRSSFIAHRAIG